jgi:glycerol kinase
MRAVLALDQGGHASRACLVGEHGRILATHAVPIDTIHGPDGEVEHDADAIVESLRAAARGVLGAVGATTTDNAALATQRSTIVCFERSSGRALSPAISWQDRRNAAWLASFGAHAERIRALTGLPLSPHYGVGKMRWCLDHLPAVRRAADRGELVMAPLASYLAMRLTVGDPLADPANASRTLLWDAQQRDWSSELLALFGIERAWLPRCTATRSDFGSLQLDDGAAQAQAGAAPRAPRPAIVLRAVTGDQSAVPFSDRWRCAPPRSRRCWPACCSRTPTVLCTASRAPSMVPAVQSRSLPAGAAWTRHHSGSSSSSCQRMPRCRSISTASADWARRTGVRSSHRIFSVTARCSSALLPWWKALRS